MKLLVTLIIGVFCSFNSFSQDYLLITPEWEVKIDENKKLAPLFYGIKKSKKELNQDKLFLKNTREIHKSLKIAFEFHFTKGWNYFNIGIIDSAIIEFNNCYLINSDDQRLIPTFGNFLSYINGRSESKDINPDSYPNYKLIEIFEFEEIGISGWGIIIAFGDGLFYDNLKQLHETHKYKSIPQDQDLDSTKFQTDSIGNILVKLRYDNDEGFYKQGVKHGKWTRYKSGDNSIDFTYFLNNGIRHGATTTYYESGNTKSKLHYFNDNIEGEEIYYTEDGRVINIKYWKENKTIKEVKFRQEKPWSKGEYILISDTGYVQYDESGYNSETPQTFIQERINDPITGENVYIYRHNGQEEIHKVPPKDGTITIYPKGHEKEGVYEWRNGKEFFVRPLD